MSKNENDQMKKEPFKKQQVNNLMYSEAEMENIKLFLQLWQDRGKPKHFEIYVGNCCVVSKTDDLTEFDLYKMMLRPTSRMVRIKIYNFVNVRNNNEYLLHIPLPTRETPLNGVPGNIDPFELADRQVEEKYREEERQMYREMYEELKDKVEQSSRRTAQEEPEREPSKAWGMALTVLKSVLKHNPDFLKKIPIPGIETLAGVVIDLADNQPETLIEQTPTENKVTFERDEQESQPEEKTTTDASAFSKQPEQTSTPQAEEQIKDEITPQIENTALKDDTTSREQTKMHPEHILDVVVMEELKSAFHTKEEQNKATLLVRMLKHHPDLVMALLADLVNAKAQGEKKEEEDQEDDTQVEPNPVSHAPPDSIQANEDTPPVVNVFFVEDLNF